MLLVGFKYFGNFIELTKQRLRRSYSENNIILRSYLTYLSYMVYLLCQGEASSQTDARILKIQQDISRQFSRPSQLLTRNIRELLEVNSSQLTYHLSNKC